MVLLVIDAQMGIVDERLFNFKELTHNIKLLIETARNNKIEVIYVQHDDGVGTGFSIGDEEFEVYKEFFPLENEKRFVKTVNSALYPNVGLLDYLKSKEEKDIIMVGLQTDYCIDATVKSGFENGFNVYIPENTNSSFNNEFMSAETTYHYYNDFIWKDRYCKCISMDEAIFLLNN